MRIQLITNASEAHQGKFIGKTAIVVDVFRSSSSIIAALESGASSIVPVETVMEAKHLFKEGDLLCGERFYKKIAGFHYGNSPSEYRGNDMDGKRLIITTTNGTRAIHRAKKASNIFIASLNNAKACAEAAYHCNQDIVLLCAGSHDQFTIEDGICAGCIISHLYEVANSNFTLKVDDLGTAMLALYRHHRHHINETIVRGLIGARLHELDMFKDIEDCAKLNSSTIVPTFVNGSIISWAQQLENECS